jgi:hypothetical protein
VETGGYTRAFETGKIDLGDQYNFLTGAFSPLARKPHCVWQIPETPQSTRLASIDASTAFE